LENLIKELPDLLANMALEEGITRAEIDEIEESIRLLKERIDEIPIALEGLESRDLRAQYQVRNIVRQIEKLYQSTKDKLKDGDESPGLIEQLKAYAPYIGMVEDAEEFLSKLEGGD
jgi:septation ring formation regulator EzrA